MEFRTEIKWEKGTQYSLERLKEHLKIFEVAKESALLEFYPEVDDKIASKIVFAIKCGESPQKSLFIFHLGTRDSSEVSGKCLRDFIGDLKRDWKFLKEKVNETGLSYKENHTKIILNSEILEKTSFSSYVKRREILGFLFSATGLASISSAIITSGFSWALLVPIIVGFIFWFMISYYGYCREGEYALK